MILVDKLAASKPAGGGRKEVQKGDDILKALNYRQPGSVTQEKAIDLYHQIKKHLSWNSDREVILRNRTLPRSDLVRLLFYAVDAAARTRQKVAPRGWFKFKSFLSSLTGVDNYLLNNSSAQKVPFLKVQIYKTCPLKNILIL